MPAFLILLLVLNGPLRAQDHTVTFNTTDAGVTRSITNWGLDTCWPSFDNMQRGLIFMGTNNVNIVRVGFVADAPLTNNDISTSQKAALQNFANLANMATAATKWDMNLASSVDLWYQSGANRVYPDRWAAAIQACQRSYNRSIWMVEGFNEPDYTPNNEGSSKDLYDVFGFLQASTNFPGTVMAGGSTLNNDVALTWFKAVSPRATVGTTHCLAGSASTYVSFLQAVTASNAVPFNPELHNVMEAIMGVEYGLKGGIWWGSAELARGNFVKACQGKRLGYADDLTKWTAAAVYRGTNGAVQAFVGESERQALPTTYRFFSKDRDVFYDGDGPRRDYTVTTTGGPGYQTAAHHNAEKMVNIAWGSDIQPAINGRYIVVNRNSSKVMEVVGSSTGDGANIQQNAYTNGLNQQWDVIPVPSTNGGDYSYFSVTAAHSGKAADLNNFSYADGANVQQWTSVLGANQQWFFQYVSNGWFYIRSKWSGKYLEVDSASTANGANIRQYSLWTPSPSHQQWRLIPVGASPTDVTPPSVVTGVSASANPLSVQLNWNASAASDLAGYTVLRATNSGGPYDIIARGFTNNAFTDKSANQNKSYYYVVKAADKSLNSSVSSAQVSATPTVIPALVARYTFDGNTNDSSGNANHPILTYGAPTFVAGKYGSAMDLSGTSQYTMLPANLLASVTNFTIATWVNWDGGAAWQRVFDFGNDTTQYMFLTPNSGDGTLRFAITTNGGGAEQILQTSPLPVGQWRHVAITLNGTTARLYTNGVLAATNTVTITPAGFNPALNYLGDSQFEADPLFNGRLDEMLVYNYALSDTEISALINTPSAPTGLTATPGSNQVGLSWNAFINATNYNVKRATVSGGPFSTMASPVTTNYTDTTALNGTNYYYVVSAVSVVGEGTNSSQVAAMPVPPIPSAPVGLTATAGDAQIGLSWSAASGATSYNVKCSGTSGNGYAIITNVTTTVYTNSSLINGTAYYYVVSAVNLGGESANSSQAAATPVSTAPVSVSLSVSGGLLHFSWPADHKGWRLQVQTNNLTTGLGVNWFDVAGSTTTNDVNLPIDSINGSVFYRLIYP